MALERALEQLRREGGVGRIVTLAAFVDEYLAQHGASAVTLKKLRFLLARAVQVFGDYRLAAQLAAGIEPFRRIYDLRHTFATFALRAGISTFELSRYMGASLTMIDRHYGHLARDGREHAIRLLDTLSAEALSAVDVRGRSVDAEAIESRPSRQRKQPLSRQ